jgi:DtxR family transcriptional regulator, Mn-dependent transcriptional regulator
MSGANHKKQEYLAETYRIAYYQVDDPYVSTSAIADEMGVSAPAVTRMVQRLKAAGFVEHEPYRGVKLTKAGEREALRSIRRHRIIERFLVDIMRFGWHEVHESADEMDTSVSDHIINRMEQMAGYPRRCPHGEPIPSVDLKMPRITDEPLHEAVVGPDWTISRVHTHDDQLLNYLNSMGLKPGVAFELVEKAPFNGPLKLRFAGNEIHIGYEVAQVMRVCPADQYEIV